jgi:hypothetical protein
MTAAIFLTVRIAALFAVAVILDVYNDPFLAVGSSG